MCHNWKIIRSEVEYEQACDRQSELLLKGSDRTVEETDELDMIDILIEKYDKENSDIGAANPLEYIRFRMEQKKLYQKDLAVKLGDTSEGHISEILRGKRPMSKRVAKMLYYELNIPAELLFRCM